VNDAGKCAVRGCLESATKAVTSTTGGKFQNVFVAYVCAAHASRLQPGTKYNAYGDGSITFRRFRPNCTVQYVEPIQ
jgi:hypothetical protein